MIFTDAGTDEIQEPESNANESNDAGNITAAESPSANLPTLPDDPTKERAVTEELIECDPVSENNNSMPDEKVTQAAEEGRGSKVRGFSGQTTEGQSIRDPSFSGQTAEDRSPGKEQRCGSSRRKRVMKEDADWVLHGKETESQNKAFDADEFEAIIVKDELAATQAEVVAETANKPRGISVSKNIDTTENEVICGEEEEAKMVRGEPVPLDIGGEVVKDIMDDLHGMSVPEDINSAENKVICGEEQDAEMNKDESVLVDVQAEVVNGMADDQNGTSRTEDVMSVPEDMDSAENKVIFGEEQDAEPDEDDCVLVDIQAEMVTEMTNDLHGVSLLEAVDASENRVLGGEDQELRMIKDGSVLVDNQVAVVQDVVDDQHGVSLPKDMDVAENKDVCGEEQETEMVKDQSVLVNIESEVAKDAADDQHGLPEDVVASEVEVLGDKEQEARMDKAESVQVEVVKDMVDGQHGISLSDNVDAANVKPADWQPLSTSHTDNQIVPGDLVNNDSEVVKELADDLQGVHLPEETGPAVEERSADGMPSTMSSVVTMDINDEDIETMDPSLAAPVVNSRQEVDSVHDGPTVTVDVNKVTTDVNEEDLHPAVTVDPSLAVPVVSGGRDVDAIHRDLPVTSSGGNDTADVNKVTLGTEVNTDNTMPAKAPVSNRLSQLEVQKPVESVNGQSRPLVLQSHRG